MVASAAKASAAGVFERLGVAGTANAVPARHVVQLDGAALEPAAHGCLGRHGLCHEDQELLPLPPLLWPPASDLRGHHLPLQHLLLPGGPRVVLRVHVDGPSRGRRVVLRVGRGQQPLAVLRVDELVLVVGLHVVVRPSTPTPTMTPSTAMTTSTPTTVTPMKPSTPTAEHASDANNVEHAAIDEDEQADHDGDDDDDEANDLLPVLVLAGIKGRALLISFCLSEWGRKGGNDGDGGHGWAT